MHRQLLPRPWGRGRSDDRGDGPIELAILALPLVVVTVMVVHAGAYFYARSIAFGAASQGVNSARSYDASKRGTGSAKALDFVAAIGPGLSNVQARQQTTATTVTVTVTGDMVTLIPGVTFRVTQSATRPIERAT